MKQFLIIIGIPFCMWTVILALEHETFKYMFLNVLLAIPKAPMIFNDILGAILGVTNKDEAQSIKDAVELDRLASESELLNRKVYETTVLIESETNEQGSTLTRHSN